jgi:hypothetical protein
MDQPVNPPRAGVARGLSSYAWWLVLCLVGLDYFSTLAYLPSMAFNEANIKAPFAALAVVAVTLLLALPVYLYVVGRSPHGQGATGLLESHVRGWSGKGLILILLGFVATDFVITRTVSIADASIHLTHNSYLHGLGEKLMESKQWLRDSVPAWFPSQWADRVFGWWDEQLIVTVILTILGFGVYFFLLRGFTRRFVFLATILVAVYLLLNAIVIGSAVVYVANRPDYVTNWIDILRFKSEDRPTSDFISDLMMDGFSVFPTLAVGLSGFELSMTSAVLVRGRPDDDPVRPRQRIRNARKMLLVAALVMSVFVLASVTVVSYLVPPGAMTGQDGKARHRALAYLAHGERIKVHGGKVRSDNPVGLDADSRDDPDENPNPDDAPKSGGEGGNVPGGPTAAEINPLFGPVFGTVYDLSALLILFLAGASVTISLRDLLPQYLTRYGMQMHWAQRIGLMLHLFNLIILIVVIVFRASISHQQGAYATSVLVLLGSAALAAAIDVGIRWRRSFFAPLLQLLLFVVCAFFLVMAAIAIWKNPAGAVIALLFVLVIFLSAGLSRWMRSTELRYYGFLFADEVSQKRWEEIRQLEFQVLVPHRADHRKLAEKDREIRAIHRITPDVPIIFIEAELGDPSDFQQQPLMRIDRDNGLEVIRVSHCASIAHVLTAIALEFSEVGRPPELHFNWSSESPLASNMHFLLWGEGNVPWMVHALINKTEPDPLRRPRVVIG